MSDLSEMEDAGIQELLHSAETDKHQQLYRILRKLQMAMKDGYCFDYEFNQLCSEVGIEL